MTHYAQIRKRLDTPPQRKVEPVILWSPGPKPSCPPPVSLTGRKSNALFGWMRGFSRDTRIGLAIIALKSTADRWLLPRALPGSSTCNANGNVCLLDDLVRPAILVAGRFLTRARPLASLTSRAAARIARDCDEFIPDPEMLVDPRFDIVTATAHLMFFLAGITGEYPTTRRRRTTPTTALQFLFWRNPDLAMPWWCAVHKFLAVCDPSAPIEFTESLIEDLKRPEIPSLIFSGAPVSRERS